MPGLASSRRVALRSFQGKFVADEGCGSTLAMQTLKQAAVAFQVRCPKSGLRVSTPKDGMGQNMSNPWWSKAEIYGCSSPKKLYRYPWPYGLDMVRYLPKCQCCLHTFVDRNITLVDTGWKILSDTHLSGLSGREWACWCTALKWRAWRDLDAIAWGRPSKKLPMYNAAMAWTMELPMLNHPQFISSSILRSVHQSIPSVIWCFMMLYDVIWCYMMFNKP